MQENSKIVNSEVLDLQNRLMVQGPTWTKRTPESDFYRESAEKSLYRIDDLLTRYKEKVSEIDFSSQQSSQLEDAISLVFKEQGLFLRDDGNLYVVHPLEVSNGLLTNFDCSSYDLLAGALLHDVVEDVDYFSKNPDEIGERYGGCVQEVVEGMTNLDASKTEIDFYRRTLKDSVGIKEGDIEKVIWNLFYYRDVKKKIQDPRILAVKSCDLYDNVFSLGNPEDCSDSQLRQANKYLPVVDLLVKGLNGLQESDAKGLGLSSEKAKEFARIYTNRIPEIQEMAKRWSLHDAQKRAMGHFESESLF